MTLPFRSVTAIDHPISHLVVRSPALQGSHPDRLPHTTLCGRLVDRESGRPVSRVQCKRCLTRTQQFTGLPTFEEAHR